MHTVIFSRYLALALTLLMVPGITRGSEVVLGNPEAPAGLSFSFPVFRHAQNHWASHFYVGALNNGTGNEFSLARVVRMGGAYRKFEPLTPELVYLNQDSVINQQVGQVSNPLYNVGIKHLALLEKSLESRRDGLELPIIVSTQEPTTIYVMDMIAQEVVDECIDDGSGIKKKTEIRHDPVTSLVSATRINDSQGQPISEVLGLATGRPFFRQLVIERNQETGKDQEQWVTAIRQLVFAPVRNNAGGAFGQPGSGIASLMYGDRETALEDGKKVSRHILDQLGNATSLTYSDPAVKIGDDLAAISDVISVYWSDVLQRFYLGLQITNGVLPASGGRALVVGRVAEDGTLVLQQVVPDTVFGSNTADEIIGSISQSAQTSLNNIQGMMTSTKLFYLIVQGGNGSPVGTTRTVFALPLVNSGVAKETQGMIADKNQMPKNYFDCISGVKTLRARALLEPAVTHDQMTVETDRAALVGAGQVPAGDITDMFVVNDAVFVVVGSALTGQLPGIFSSEALFDETGKINGWTSWRRVAGTTESVFGAAFDFIEGNFIMMSGADAQSLTTVQRTAWGTGATNGLADLTTFATKAFPAELNGIIGLSDLPPQIPGINNISMLIATGYKKVALIETGVVNAGVLIPNSGDFLTDLQQFANGAIDVTLPGALTPRIVEISGGALSQLGPIVTTALGSAGATSRLFVGGIYGVAVLVDQQGNGWNTAAGLGPNFAGLTQGMSFARIGDYSMVRKLVADGNYLYVLTDSQLDRIDMAATNFSTQNLSRITLAVPGDIVGVSEHGTFYDLIISQKLALLATSFGIAHNGKGTAINDPAVVGAQSLNWVSLLVPESIDPVLQLVPFSVSNLSYDVSNMGGGMVYLLSADRGFNKAEIARVAIADTSVNQVTATTVQFLPDMFTQCRLSPFFRFKTFREGFNIINGVIFASLNKRNCERPLFEILNSKDIRQVVLDFTTYSDIRYYAVSSASGSVIVAGDFGFRFNE